MLRCASAAAKKKYQHQTCFDLHRFPPDDSKRIATPVLPIDGATRAKLSAVGRPENPIAELTRPAAREPADSADTFAGGNRFGFQIANLKSQHPAGKPAVGGLLFDEGGGCGKNHVF